MPEIVFVELDPVLAKAEPDQEIQELIARSAGLNLGLDFLPGALSFTPAPARGRRRSRQRTSSGSTRS